MDDELSVKLDNLLSREFLATCSRFTSCTEFFAACDPGLITIDDVNAFPQDQLDAFVRDNTTYRNWNVMFGDAGAFYVKKQIGL